MAPNDPSEIGTPTFIVVDVSGAEEEESPQWLDELLASESEMLPRTPTPPPSAPSVVQGRIHRTRFTEDGHLPGPSALDMFDIRPSNAGYLSDNSSLERAMRHIPLSENSQEAGPSTSRGPDITSDVIRLSPAANLEQPIRRVRINRSRSRSGSSDDDSDKENRPVGSRLRDKAYKGRRARSINQLLVTFRPLFNLVNGASEYKQKLKLFNLFDELTEYCISIESDKDPGNYHFHCYLKFQRKQRLDEWNEYIRDLLGDNIGALDIQPLKSRRNTLKYITKEDRAPLTNIKISDLSFNAQIYDWAKRTTRFDMTNWFVVLHNQRWRYLQQYWEAFKQSSTYRFRGFSFKTFAPGNWAMLCTCWWNARIKSINDNNFKKKALYVWGPTNVGKSTFIESLIGLWNMDSIFYPGVGKFFMMNMNEELHKVILFEEFDGQYFAMSMLKRLLEGRKYAYPVKCQGDRYIQFDGPIIFISNHEPNFEDAFMSRLEIVHASEPFWEVPSVPVPKEEADPPSSPSVISISSSQTSVHSSSSCP